MSSGHHSAPPRNSTRYRTASKPPPAFEAVEAALTRAHGTNGYADTNEIIGIIRGAARTIYGEDSSASELVRFLQYYGVLNKPGKRWILDQDRLRRVRVACEQGEDLSIDFVLDAHVANGQTHSAAGPNGPVVIQRIAYMTHFESEALAAIEICGKDTVAGEFRSPMHLDDDAFAASDFGKLFGAPREVFADALERLVAGCIVEVRKGTGPAASFDALVVTVPRKNIQVIRIANRRACAVPGIVMDLIVRILDLEGLASFKEGLTAAVRKAMVERLSRRGIKNGANVVELFADRIFHYNASAPQSGWGLVLPGVKGVDAVVCLPGFGPVEFVEDSVFLRNLPRDMTIPVAVPKAGSETIVVKPRPMVLGDVQSLGDEELAAAQAEAEALVQTLKAEGPRREAEREKAERKRAIAARLEEARAAEAAQAVEEARAQEVARAAAEEAARKALAAEETRRAREALEAELAGL